ncbi:MAG: CBS domain-containing protein [Myxococcales bacterium]|jgi:acetoin utilization protein AcuB
MAPAPHTISMDRTLESAAHRMDELGVRHLPVVDGDRLVGVISERDIALVDAVDRTELKDLTVEQAMTGVPYCVSLDTPIADVARHMASRKLGSAVVVEGSRILGVFTTTNALEALSRALDTASPGHANDEPSQAVVPGAH